MVPRDRYSRVNLVLQSFPTPITFAMAVTRDVSKRFYYLDRPSLSALVSRVIWKDISEGYFAELPNTFSSLRRVFTRYKVATYLAWTRCHVHAIYDEIIRQWGGVCSRENDFVWRFYVSKRAPARPVLPSSRERIQCIVIEENACSGASFIGASVLYRAFLYISTLSLMFASLELPIPNRSAAPGGNLGEIRWRLRGSFARLHRGRHKEKERKRKQVK